MSILETYLAAWGLICVGLVPYLLYLNYTKQKECDFYFGKWKKHVFKGGDK